MIKGVLVGIKKHIYTCIYVYNVYRHIDTQDVKQMSVMCLGDRSGHAYHLFGLKIVDLGDLADISMYIHADDNSNYIHMNRNCHSMSM